MPPGVGQTELGSGRADVGRSGTPLAGITPTITGLSQRSLMGLLGDGAKFDVGVLDELPPNEEAAKVA